MADVHTVLLLRNGADAAVQRFRRATEGGAAGSTSTY